MDKLHKEVIKFIDLISKINQIDMEISNLNKKNFTNGDYSLWEKILGCVLCILSICIILYFFNHSLKFVGVDLVHIFFYNNNLLLAIIIIILTTFSSIEISILIIDKFTLKKCRDKNKINNWHNLYTPQIQLLQIEKENNKKKLVSDIIPSAYINIEALTFFKNNIEKYNLNNIDKLIDLYQNHKIMCRNYQLLDTLTKNRKK